MEADWEVEIGPGAPVIDVQWSGFVDLRSRPSLDTASTLSRARSLPETAHLPALAKALAQLNSCHSPVWTSKCDLWSLDPGEYDADEMEATPEDAQYAWACYIDLLPKSDQQWISPQMAVQACQAVCMRLRATSLANCRADLIVRQAVIAPDLIDHGITAYLTSCGKTSEAAKEVLSKALDVFVHALGPASTIE